MSESFLHLIPEDPEFVPDSERIRRSQVLIEARFPGVKVVCRVCQNVEFFDAGSNFERVSCPICAFDLMDLWPAWMSFA